MARIQFQTFRDHDNKFILIGALIALLVGIGALSALYMEHNGHIVTGMNNQIVWGMPHVFAIFLIVAASGALNIASISSVFNKKAYKPYARFSGLLAICLLIGGLLVLVLDLGRPDRLIVAMTTYNFKSIFAWNIILYNGFIAIVIVYLWTMFQKNLNGYTKYAGFAAFIWRLLLTMGTGSIFGFLVAREAYDSAIYAPLFIISSFVYGLAFTVLFLAMLEWTTGKNFMPKDIVRRFRGLFIVFIGGVLFFTLILHLANLYASQHHGVEEFLLVNGGNFPTIFWGGQIILGSLLPLAILASSSFGLSRRGLVLASILFLLGGIAQIYFILIGGQSYPLNLFPGMEVTQSGFSDGAIGHYSATMPEIMLGIGGLSLALLMTGIAVKVLPFLPKPWADEA